MVSDPESDEGPDDDEEDEEGVVEEGPVPESILLASEDQLSETSRKRILTFSIAICKDRY